MFLCGKFVQNIEQNIDFTLLNIAYIYFVHIDSTSFTVIKYTENKCKRKSNLLKVF